jgi:RNA polymerase sigma factor (sigma-70 family)
VAGPTRAGGPGAPRRNIVPPAREELERARARDPQALGALFERYFDLVYGLAYRLMGARAQAEDVTQDVFLKVHRAADRLDPSRDPAPWLAAITYNACRDVWRSGAHRMSLTASSVEDDPEFGPALASAADGPEEDVLSAERERLVQDAVRRLPEALRVPVVLHDYQGLSHQEIAALLGVNHAAARKRYSRALSALAAMLEETLG